MNHKKNSRTLRFFAGLMLCFSQGVTALPSDKLQNITISAESASIDQKQGVVIYLGAVKVTQGTLEITADKVTLRTGSDKKAETVIAEGAPARFQQQLEADKPIVHAEANSITYAVTHERLSLDKNAFVEQNGATTSGGKIDYDITNGTVNASGIGKESGRVEFVIPPQTSTKD
jgi:lipopolysaccharide export system protein LptA